MHRHATIPSTVISSVPPMHELIRLIENINTVIKDYLRYRYNVSNQILKEKTYADIIARLRLNVHYYKELTEAQAPVVDQSTYGMVKNALVTSYQFVNKTVRYLANTDGTYRLDTMAWLCWSLQCFRNHLSRFEDLNESADFKKFQTDLAKDAQDFLQAVDRILNVALPDEKSAFKLSREKKFYRIYGLKDDGSELGILLRRRIFDEFDCDSLKRKLSADITAKASSLALNKKNSQQAKELVQRLEESNADLLRQLEVSHNSMQQLKSELLNSRERAATIASELDIIKSRDDTLARRIDRLEKEKSILEKKQSSLDKNSLSVSHLQSELEAMQQALLTAENERNEVIKDRKQLLSQVESEQQHQAVLQQQLMSAHTQTHELAGQLDQPQAEYSYHEEATVFDEGDEDFFDIDKLNAVLHQLMPSEAAVSEKANIALLGYPGFEEEFEDGLTAAQSLAVAGEFKGLKVLLKRDPELVNKICGKNSKNNPHGKKTLLELVLLDSDAPIKARKDALINILQCRPDVISENKKVFADINLRLQNNESCPPELCQLFCEYVVARNTCSSEALTLFKERMNSIEQLVEQLQDAGWNDALRKLSLPLTVCRALRYGYINGSFSKSAPFLDGDKLADCALYEVFYDAKKRQEVEQQYERKFGVPLLRTNLLTMLGEYYQAHQSFGVSVQGFRENTIVSFSDDELRSLPARSQASATNHAVRKNAPADEYALLYRELITHMITVIDRFGVILNAKGFNAYQRNEIAMQIVVEDQEVELQVLPQVGYSPK